MQSEASLSYKYLNISKKFGKKYFVAIETLAILKLYVSFVLIYFLKAPSAYFAYVNIFTYIRVAK